MSARSENERRAQQAIDALADYLQDENELETAVTDLLSDLRHLADRDGFDLAARDRMAHQHYTAEVGEARDEAIEAQRDAAAEARAS